MIKQRLVSARAVQKDVLRQWARCFCAGCQCGYIQCLPLAFNGWEVGEAAARVLEAPQPAAPRR